MHVLLVTHYFEPSGGAAAVRLTQLARTLQARGHRLTVLTTLPHYPRGVIDEGYRGRLFRVETRDGLRVIYTWLWATPSPRISRKLVSQLSFMLTAILRGAAVPRPDVTFIEAQPIFAGIAGRVVSVLKRAPYVLNVSDLWPDHLLTVGAMQETDLVYRAARHAMDSGYRGAAAVTTMSPAWSRKVAEYGGEPGKVHTILRGADTTRFRPGLDTRAFRERYDLGNERLITFIGTFATQYDFDAILDTAAHFRDRPGVRVVIIGTGSQREQIQARIQSGELAHVRLIDWLPHDEIPYAWAASHVNYWALRDVELYRGTIPAKLFEAFAAGTPVAAANACEAADIIRQSGGGEVVSPGDTPGLIAAIERLLDDDGHHAQASRRAREYAEEHFAFERTADRYEQVLRAVVSGEAGSQRDGVQE